MRLLIVLTCVLAGCQAQRPHPCKSPPLLTGAFTVSTQNEKLYIYSQFEYDGLGERIRLLEFGNFENKSFNYDVLLLFREAAMLEINYHNRTCNKKPFKTDFQPMGVPKDATLLSQAILGSSSGPGQGLLINTWWGDLPDKTGKYLSTTTEFGCIMVSTAYQLKTYGWTVTNFFNNVIGIADPSLLNPPDFCKDAKMQHSKEEPADFLSLFQNRK
ncbi:ependymin-like [Cololabis saira]|uniref:ependymin-like n=1 Tax=Cololabis saira TaxID=129043 RepID=UPI002AD538D0|nr:ependymin-like [Cololabis saira]